MLQGIDLIPNSVQHRIEIMTRDHASSAQVGTVWHMLTDLDGHDETWLCLEVVL